MKLPLKFENPSDENNYTIVDSDGWSVMNYERWDSCSSLPTYEEAQEIVKLSENFPEVVRLLNLALHHLHSEAPIKEQINQFLTKLEEDENV